MSKEERLYVDPSIQHHQLDKQWTFSYCIPSRLQGTRDEISALFDSFRHDLADFSSIEDFLVIYNSIDEKPSNLPKKCRYYVFQKGIKPLWEDKENVDGYCINVEFPNDPEKGLRGPRSNRKRAENAWYEIVLSTIGKVSPEFSKNINGIEFNNRGNSLRVGVWVNKLMKEEERKKLNESIEKIIGTPLPPIKVVQMIDVEKNKPVVRTPTSI